MADSRQGMLSSLYLRLILVLTKIEKNQGFSFFFLKSMLKQHIFWILFPDNPSPRQTFQSTLGTEAWETTLLETENSLSQSELK